MLDNNGDLIDLGSIREWEFRPIRVHSDVFPTSVLACTRLHPKMRGCTTCTHAIIHERFHQLVRSDGLLSDWWQATEVLLLCVAQVTPVPVLDLAISTASHPTLVHGILCRSVRSTAANVG
jgi:hypothetical protein